ncbi:AzlD domain-containing protein [Streptomyces sp. AC536]|uniref:AzlD domain-containing protein n=1 Tax=Streptomyces buecherae TaxID=2763006 RepID=UPI00164DA587|nr:AzlD domain-containing protein [Streptomyces buecherae]MBC3981839.1 AzlD domain-containing protein [Streptomyces buecherae]QNJ38802.1 AzlD domain-containing protein [Streptomyces buecherae]
MPYSPTVLVALLTLAAGTFVFRFTGPVLRSRLTFPPRAEHLLNTSAMVLLGSLVVTATLATGQHVGGVARPMGVVVGGVLACRKAPFLVVVIAAAAVTAVLRLLSVP